MLSFSHKFPSAYEKSTLKVLGDMIDKFLFMVTKMKKVSLFFKRLNYLINRYKFLILFILLLKIIMELGMINDQLYDIQSDTSQTNTNLNSIDGSLSGVKSIVDDIRSSIGY